MTAQHRKRVKSYNTPGDAHELTFSCFQRLPLLSKERTCRWFVEALDSARRRRNFLVWAYVIMPEHVHVLVWPRDEVYEVRLIRAALKIPVQRQALAFLRARSSPFLNVLRDVRPNGKVHYRFWQRGGGYDRNVNERATLLAMIEYIHNNPVRRGLVKHALDWPWSSARFYAGWDDVMLKMDSLAEFIGLS